MPVTIGDLSFRRSAAVSADPDLNGGALSSTLMSSALFPDVTGAERTTGIERWRKIFLKNEAGSGALPEKVSSQALALVDAKVYLANTSAAEDYFLIKAAGSKTGVQSDETDTGWCAAGTLLTDVTIDAVTLDVVCEDDGSAGEFFQNEGVVLISDGTTKQFVTLNAGDGVVWNGAVATLTFDNTPLQYDFTAKFTDTADIFDALHIGVSTAGWTVGEHLNRRVSIVSGMGSGQTRRIISNDEDTAAIEYEFSPVPDGTSVFEIYLTTVSQCAEVGDITPSYDNLVVTSAAGTFTPGITLYPVGCIDEDWKLLFSNATTFTLEGLNIVGPVGTFTTDGSDIKPTHGASFYFKIPITAFGGTFVNGNTITFSTISASKAIWVKEVVPAGSSAHRANSVDLGATGDTI